MLDPLLEFSSGSIIYAQKEMRHMPQRLQRKIPNKKADPLQQVCARAHTHTRSYTCMSKYHSREMVAIRFVRCNRSNFGSEPLLMSTSLMYKSSGPSAKLIRSPYNPTQVQPCSLLHCLSCVPNTVRPPTANKPASRKEKYTPTVHAILLREKEETKGEASWRH